MVLLFMLVECNSAEVCFAMFLFHESSCASPQDIDIFDLLRDLHAGSQLPQDMIVSQCASTDTEYQNAHVKSICSCFIKR